MGNPGYPVFPPYIYVMPVMTAAISDLEDASGFRWATDIKMVVA